MVILHSFSIAQNPNKINCNYVAVDYASECECISAFISVRSSVESKKNPKVFNDLCGFPFVL